MYNDSLKVANRIISSEGLAEIFYKMYEKMEKYRKLADQEKQQNQMLDYSYQSWKYKYYDGSMKFTVDFYDDTNITFDNFNNFIGIFNGRLEDIKKIYVTYSIHFTTKYIQQDDVNISHRIYLDIKKDKMSVDAKIDSSDPEMNEVYETISKVIRNAPEKYDRVIKKKDSIYNKIVFAVGSIPSLVIMTLLMFSSAVRNAYSSTFVLYPIGVVVLSFIIGGIIKGAQIDRFYRNLMPEEVYDGYDYNSGKKKYKYDMDKFLTTSEILIGKNVNNLDNRKKVLAMESKYKKYIPYELIALLVLSIIAILL